MITPKVKSGLSVPKSVLNEFIEKVASDANRIVPFEDLDELDEVPVNIGKFHLENFKISELSLVVKRKRNASQPGPNQIPCKVYKKCPRIMNYIFRIMFIGVRYKVIPLNWRVSDGIMIPKV